MVWLVLTVNLAQLNNHWGRESRLEIVQTRLACECLRVVVLVISIDVRRSTLRVAVPWFWEMDCQRIEKARWVSSMHVLISLCIRLWVWCNQLSSCYFDSSALMDCKLELWVKYTLPPPGCFFMVVFYQRSRNETIALLLN